MSSADVRALVWGLLGIGALTLLFSRWTPVSSPATVALSFLVVVLFVAAAARLWVAVSTSLAAMLAFNFFFLPPVGTFTIADPQNWVALIAFLAVSLVATNLSAVARARTQEAVARRDELGRLFDLSRDILLITDSQEASARLAGFVSRRFDLDYAAICIPHGADWDVFHAGAQDVVLDRQDLTRAFAAAQTGHGVTGAGVSLVPLRLGTKPIGLLAAAGRPIETGTFDALTGIVAIAIERAQFLDERKSAELARQSEELKSALLASLGHDLRTPLTAIRVAASNLQAAWPTQQERREQTEVILSEVERLTRLFQNILEMARIDAGAVVREQRWVAPSEIVEAARTSVEYALKTCAFESHVESERVVLVDPRLTAAALSHLLENAAQYAPPGSAVVVHGIAEAGSLELSVRDHGPGIPPADATHLFERFYRGADAKRRRTGTGMGLAIAKGLLAVERGEISAQNCADGGALFTIRIPAEVK